MLALMFAMLLAGRSLAGLQMEHALAPAMFGVSIVIDAGHGGWDPGMVGSSSEEKEINLAVAKALAEYCRAAGAAVSLTREGDTALADSKREDMEARVALCTAAEADIFISLHCNSYPADSSQHGAQVFYRQGNTAGETLAGILQNALQEELANTDRSALPHSASYLLEQLDIAAVICEMGFLSHAEEEALLVSSAYQWQLAWTLFCGLVDYLAQTGAAEQSLACAFPPVSAVQAQSGSVRQIFPFAAGYRGQPARLG